MTYTTLISPAELQQLQASGTPLMVFDCSFDLMQPGAGAQRFAEAHIPGAVYAHLDKDLSAKSGPAASGGRHPLPTREAFAATLARLGITPATQVIALDRQGGPYAARL